MGCRMGPAARRIHVSRCRQCLSLGELDLEDFLVKAGIPRSCNENRPMGLNTLPLLLPPPPSMDGPISPVHTPAQHGDWMISPHNKAFSQQHQQATEQILQGSAMVEAALSPGHDETNADLLTAHVGILGLPGRKRHTEVPIEEVFQKRQRRMMKNRESAARSRARKQAYTMELELEIDQLKEEIMTLLRKQEDASELSNKQVFNSEEVGRLEPCFASMLLARLPMLGTVNRGPKLSRLLGSCSSFRHFPTIIGQCAQFLDYENIMNFCRRGSTFIAGCGGGHGHPAPGNGDTDLEWCGTCT